jgi:hypothetical protein
LELRIYATLDREPGRLSARRRSMNAYITSNPVDDQAKPLDFTTSKLESELTHDIPQGHNRWITVTAKDDPDGARLLLEPSDHLAVAPFKAALVADGSGSAVYLFRGRLTPLHR